MKTAHIKNSLSADGLLRKVISPIKNKRHDVQRQSSPNFDQEIACKYPELKNKFLAKHAPSTYNKPALYELLAGRQHSRTYNVNEPQDKDTMGMGLLLPYRSYKAAEYQYRKFYVWLLHELKSIKNLKGIALALNDPFIDPNQVFKVIVNQAKNMNSLHLSTCEFKMQNITLQKRALEMISQMPKLEHLSLNRVEMTCALITKILKSRNFSTIDLSDNFVYIDPQSANRQIKLEFLESHTKLRSLNLSNFELQNLDTEYLANFLGQSKFLEFLSISHPKILGGNRCLTLDGDHYLPCIFNKLSQSTSLRHLVLLHNGLENTKDFEALINFLKLTQTLKSLDISNMFTWDSSTKTNGMNIAACLAQNNSIKYLYLCENWSRNDSIKILFEFLKNKNLTKIDLGKSKLLSQGLQALQDAKKENLDLPELDISKVQVIADETSDKTFTQYPARSSQEPTAVRKLIIHELHNTYIQPVKISVQKPQAIRSSINELHSISSFFEMKKKIPQLNFPGNNKVLTQFDLEKCEIITQDAQETEKGTATKPNNLSGKNSLRPDKNSLRLKEILEQKISQIKKQEKN